jgi:hypothetical protein
MSNPSADPDRPLPDQIEVDYLQAISRAAARGDDSLCHQLATELGEYRKHLKGGNG